MGLKGSSRCLSVCLSVTTHKVSEERGPQLTRGLREEEAVDPVGSFVYPTQNAVPWWTPVPLTLAWGRATVNYREGGRQIWTDINTLTQTHTHIHTHDNEVKKETI